MRLINSTFSWHNFLQIEKTKRNASIKASVLCHYRKRKDHKPDHYWYLDVCAFYGKGHIMASCWEKASHLPKSILFSNEEWQEDFPMLIEDSKPRIQNKRISKKLCHHCKLSGHWEAKYLQLHPKLHHKNHNDEDKGVESEV